MENIIVIDNGGGTLRAGYAGAEKPVVEAPNCAVKPKGHLVQQLVLDQVPHVTSHATYMRPFDRGYLVNWNYEEQIWSRLFSENLLGVDPKSKKLMVTSPLMNPTQLQNDMDVAVFEEFQFEAYARVPSSELCARSLDTKNPCSLVIDSGFSFTHVVPLCEHRIIPQGITRLNVGGKLLTNYLKEIVSFRQWNMLDEPVIMNSVKEALCYCSLEFANDMKRCASSKQRREKCPIEKEWVLPDYQSVFKGYVKDDTSDPVVGTKSEQVLKMGIERITVPEVLFNPSDIGLKQAGLAAAIVESVKQCPEQLQGLFYENMFLTGGNTLFPNFKEKLEKDLRPLVSQEYHIRIEQASDPLLHTWKAAAQFATTPDFESCVVTRAEYLEYGSNICRKRFHC